MNWIKRCPYSSEAVNVPASFHQCVCLRFKFRCAHYCVYRRGDFTRCNHSYLLFWLNKGFRLIRTSVSDTVKWGYARNRQQVCLPIAGLPPFFVSIYRTKIQKSPWAEFPAHCSWLVGLPRFSWLRWCLHLSAPERVGILPSCWSDA